MNDNNTFLNVEENNVFVPGELELKLVPYKNKDGGFKVGTLRLPFCEVEIKDSWIENFDLGTYTGSFLLQKISIKTIPTRKGGVFSVLQAEVPRFSIEDMQQHHCVNSSFNEDEPARVDPAEEEQSPAQLTAVVCQNLPVSETSPVSSGQFAAVSPVSSQSAESRLDDASVSILMQVAGVSSLLELPDEVEADQTLPRAVLRDFYNLININKGGTHKFAPAIKKWVRV